MDLLDISDENLDRYGDLLFENEETMLDLLRWDLGSKTFAANLKGWEMNRMLPVLLRRAGAIWFKPSRPLYDRYVKGVPLDFSGGAGKTRTATFEEVGYRKEGT
jgi:hypothetical protein